MNQNIFDAIDNNNLGVLDAAQVEIFIRAFLRGNQVEGTINTSFEMQHDLLIKRLFQINDENELTLEDLTKFMGELMKQQIRMLTIRLEEQRYERAQTKV